MLRPKGLPEAVVAVPAAGIVIATGAITLEQFDAWYAPEARRRIGEARVRLGG